MANEIRIRTFRCPQHPFRYTLYSSPKHGTASPLSTVRKRPPASQCGFHPILRTARSREAGCETAIDPHGYTACSPPRAAQECSLPPARLCRQYQDQHCWHTAKMEKVKKLLPSVQSAMSLTDMEILHIRQAGGELARGDQESRPSDGNGFPPPPV
jgi:hypothetical protein